MPKRHAKLSTTPSAIRPPIVTVLGHVDHGKTTLLDAIRKTNVAGSEHGGITQRIGAYQVEVNTKEGKKKITFIDTPGHEAFAKMRSRGAKVADIAVLVISAVDGVMPQTKEAIAHIKQAGIPTVVAINKMDLPEAAPDRVKRELAEASVLVEGYGGDTVAIPISAKQGQGITELLEMIILLSELKGIPSEPHAPFAGVIIESKRDRQRGVVATLIVQRGILRVGDTIYAGTIRGKVRAMMTSFSSTVKEAHPADAVEVLGFAEVPPIGVPVSNLPTSESPPIVREAEQPGVREAEATIKLIVKADSLGTLEAVKTLLPNDVTLILSGVGEVTESDVLFAKTVRAMIVGFGVRILPAAAKLAEFERVMVKTYGVIYELAEEIAEVIAAIKEGKLEEILGQGEILADFPFDRERIAGIRVQKGRLARGDKVRLEREGKEIGRAKIKSIRQQKTDVNKVEVGQECGVLFEPALDFQNGDAIISYR